MLTIVPIVDAVPAPVPATQSFPGTVEAQWSGLKLAGLNSQTEFHPNLGCFLVRIADQYILCDAGIGPGPNQYLDGLEGHLPERLGIDPQQIGMVIFTHLHMDHIGWTTLADEAGARRPTFPNAQYVVADEEYAFWAAHPGTARPHHIEAFETIFRPLEMLGVLRTVSYGEEIVSGVSLLSFPGHTPGHAVIRFAGEDRDFVVAGDVFHCPGQIERPDFCHRADMAPELARQSRVKFIKQCASENWLIGAGHFRNGLQLGTIVAQDGGFVFAPR